MSFVRASTIYVISVGVIAAAVSGCLWDKFPDKSDDGGTPRTGSGGAGANTTGGTSTTGSGGGGTSMTGGGGGGGPSGAGGGPGTIDPGNPDAGSGGGGGLTVDAACVAEPVRGEKKPVDLYLMMD